MKDYFEAEMRHLNEGCKQFAKHYPEHARRLNLEGVSDRDPNVDRLLEGVAYLTGKIQQKLDNDLLIVSEMLLEQHFPRALQPIVSRAIAQYAIRENQPTPLFAMRVDKADGLISKAVGEENTPCMFSIEDTVELQPIALTDIYYQPLATGHASLSLTLKTTTKAQPLTFTKLRFFIHDDHAKAMALFEALYGEIPPIELVTAEERFPLVLNHPFLKENVAATSPIASTSVLEDYFLFKEKLLFFELQSILPEGINIVDEQWKISFNFSQHNPLLDELKVTSLLLGCVPISNYYHSTAEPIFLDGKKANYPLHIDLSRRQSILLQDIVSITSDVASGESKRFIPFTAYQQQSPHTIYYRLARSERALQLTFTGQGSFIKQALSIEVGVSNGDYPRKHLCVGDLALASRTKKEWLAATNITRPTPFYARRCLDDRNWQLISLLSKTYTSWSDVSVIHAMLYEASLRDAHNPHIKAIQSLEITPYQRIQSGVLARGIKLTMTVDDNSFSSSGECCLFGMTMHHFFLSHVLLNHFLETELVMVQKNKVFKWHSRNGIQPLK